MLGAKVNGVQKRKAGNGIETGCNQVEVAANPNDIGVGVVGVENRILVGSVSGVGIPHLGNRLRACGDCRCEAQRLQQAN